MNNFSLKLISLLLFIIVFSNILSFFTSKMINYLDELFLIVIIAVFFVFLFISNHVKKISLSIFLSYILLLAISNGPNFDIFKVLTQILIHLKFFIFYITIYILYQNNQKLLVKLFYTILLFSILGMFLNIFMQENFNLMFGLKNMYRNGVLRINGFQFNSNALAYIFLLGFIYLVFRYKRIGIFIFLSIIFLSINLYLTTARTPLLIYLIITYFYFLDRMKIPKIILFLFFILFLASIVIFLQDTFLFESISKNINMIDSGNNEEKYIRGIMIYYSIVLFFQYFPFGSGAASFGSLMSEGSKVYENLDIDNLRFFKNMSGVYDCNIATILGEFGFTGIIIYSWLFWSLWKFIKKKMDVNINLIYYKVLLFSIFIIMIKGSMLMHTYSSLIFAIALNLKVYKKGIK